MNASEHPLKMMSGFKRICGYARPYWKSILLTFICMIIYSAGLNGRVYLLKPFLEEVILPAENLRSMEKFDAISSLAAQKEAPPHQLAKERRQIINTINKRMKFLLLIAVGIVFVIPCVSYIKEYVSAVIVNLMIVDMRSDLCRTFLNMPLGFHVKQRQGEIFTRLDSDITKAGTSFKIIFGDLIQETLTLLLGVSAMIYLNWQMTLLIFSVLPPLTFILVRFGKKIRKRSVSRQEEVSNLTNTMVQIFSGIKIVKAFGREAYEAERYHAANFALFNKNKKVFKARVGSQSITELFNNITYILFLAVGIIAIVKTAFGLSFPILVAFLGLTTTLYRPVKSISSAYNMMSDSIAGMQRVVEMLDLEPEASVKADWIPFNGIHHQITFEHVYFAYEKGKMVLEDIHFEIKRGETVALVGKTGAGKTTLGDLLLRFYNPTQGKLQIDGTDLERFDPRSYLDHVAIVTQEPFLFDASIEENIRYGKPQATLEEVTDAARSAFIHEFITSLPQGYQTRVGDRGTRLSGGERQRITIARALLKNPTILILDEATASLDSESEKQVKKAIEHLMAGRTTLVIAHRFSTIEHADKIIVLADRRIETIGTHAELIAHDGLYKELYQLQLQFQSKSTTAKSPRSKGLYRL